ncbi:uncharacterized protein N7459_006914 [Penicillium hispanicum]|uniref:uncharacterized protein n=1 Tax=Penicillium hispanicum TaxID=1080232 RepID=UPI0025413EE6|nr:uncharacterized protein N7459_006914 [Penicillium hispanicum]KAJ5577950.1 hypothetical protein N7459_006914 [Penicillium hispanicum]
MSCSLETIRKGIVGSWKLVSYVSKPVNGDGPTRYPLGEDARGYIFYTPEGYMSAQLMASGSKPYTTQDPYRAADDEAADAACHFLAYSGPYEVLLQEGVAFMKHHMDLALVPNWTGNYQLRKCDLKGDELTLSPDRPWLMDGVLVNQYLTWKRV